jgi:predicted RNase H-like HicB family nuclease
MLLHVSTGREMDGRWIAEVDELEGVTAHGLTRDVAVTAVKALARRVVADRLAAGELAAEEAANVSFVATVG